MRTSALLTVACAAVALASPVDKRGEVVVTSTDVVVVTNIVTVTAGQSPATSVANAAPTYSHRSGSHHGKYGGWGSSHGAKPTASPSNPSAPPPAPTAPTSYPAPTSYQPAPTQQPPSSEQPTPYPTHTPPSTEQPTPTPTPTPTPAPTPEPTSEPPAPTPSPQPPADGIATSYQQAVVQHHNYHRANHSCEDIKWSQALADTALKIAKTCIYGHNMDMDGGLYGQNVAAGLNSSDISNVISDMFYNGEVGAFAALYGQASPDMSNFHAWGHMSQVVWKGSTEVGCATYDCRSTGLQNFGYDNAFFTVCNYKQPGNVIGAFDTNVGKSLNKPTITGDYNVDKSKY